MRDAAERPEDDHEHCNCCIQPPQEVPLLHALPMLPGGDGIARGALVHRPHLPHELLDGLPPPDIPLRKHPEEIDPLCADKPILELAWKVGDGPRTRPELLGEGGDLLLKVVKESALVCRQRLAEPRGVAPLEPSPQCIQESPPLLELPIRCRGE